MRKITLTLLLFISSSMAFAGENIITPRVVLTDWNDSQFTIQNQTFNYDSSTEPGLVLTMNSDSVMVSVWVVIL